MRYEATSRARASLDRDRVDWRADPTDHLQRRRRELERVAAVFAAVGCERLQIPVLAEHQPHVPQRQQVHRQVRAGQDVAELLKRRVFWLSAKAGKGAPVNIVHPYDCQYVNFTREKMLELAQKLASQGLLNLESEFATATNALLQQEPEFIAAMHKGIEAGIAANKVSA